MLTILSTIFTARTRRQKIKVSDALAGDDVSLPSDLGAASSGRADQAELKLTFPSNRIGERRRQGWRPVWLGYGG